jgi:hypothetical protein
MWWNGLTGFGNADFRHWLWVYGVEGLRLKLDTTQAVIVATAVLHNIACNENEPEPPVNVNNVGDDDQNEIRGEANNNT